MRSALICVFCAVLVQSGRTTDSEFKPLPIPVSEWNYDRRDSRAGTLHEAIHTDSPPSVAAVPAHYWEDALRHSVYLTLVRDKIDQLIGKGEVISPDMKPDQQLAKDVDDHDLWEKIKSAPFDRVDDEEPPTTGDVTVMAKGRLVEDNGGFRFAEDERTKDKCSDAKCMEGIKAFWSVKRVRQRETETSPGRYHYELTFSVNSQPPKKQRKPYENPVRTFTVKESSPERVIDMPQEHRTTERLSSLPSRPERAVWLHKNIVRTKHHQGRQQQNGLDRFFSSLFSDEDDEYEPPRYRPNPPGPHGPPPSHQHFSKIGYVGSPSDQQKKQTPYPYKPHSHTHTYKHTRPLSPPSYQHGPQPHYGPHQPHYVDAEVGVVSAPYIPDQRYVLPGKPPVKSNRPPVLPTPLGPLPPKNWTYDEEARKPYDNVTDNETKAPEIITRVPDIITGHHKPYNYKNPRPGPMKINYLPDHVRPPIYNAPPGVFVTLDKNPFKPLPPMKLVTKYHKHKPQDFRPSPQVLDMQQFSEPDPLFDQAFKPITWNYNSANSANASTQIQVAESSTQVPDTKVSDTTVSDIKTKGKKPPKKHETHRSTTQAPEIITASGGSAEDDVQWANLINAFSKTTPMVSHKKAETVETTTQELPSSTTTVSTTLSAKRRTTTTTEAVPETTTTQKPKKRTRPPPKFNKTEQKPKKHKRVTTTTTTKAPEKKSTEDLTPQASSAVTPKPSWTPVNKTQAQAQPNTTTTTSTTTTAKPSSTTTKATTTKATTTKATTTTEQQVTSTSSKPKTKNRFRQSTLMYKGTSLKHDKWSSPSASSAEKVSDKVTSAALHKPPPRRKGSNFHGYSSTQKTSEEQEQLSVIKLMPTKTTSPTYEDTADQYESNSESSDYDHQEENYEQTTASEQQETRDHSEYVFHSSYDKTNEVEDETGFTTEEVITTPYSVPKNKTKCKKKKNTTTTEAPVTEAEITTTETAASIFDELFGGFGGSDKTVEGLTTAKSDLNEQQSESHAQYTKLDDDLQDFLDSLEGGSREPKDLSYQEEDVDKDHVEVEEDDVSFEGDDEGVSPREADSYDEYTDRDRPYSLLELMAME